MKVTYELQLYDDQQRIVKLSVADTGIGISERDQARIFTPHFKTQEAASR